MNPLKYGAFIFLSFCCSSAFGQTYENLVFEGGGIRGIAYSGAVDVLQKEGVLKNLKRVAGTSVGAIQATLVALNYSPDEMATIISELNLRHFNDGELVFIGGSHRLWKNYGWYKGDKLLNWIAELIRQKTGNADLTFQELHELSKTSGYKDLYITGTNLSAQSPEVFSYENFPSLKIKDAVRISVSVPLYYRAAFMDSLGVVTYNPKKNKSYDVFVDGGILNNFPIHTFDSTRYFKPEETSSTYQYNPGTLGIRLDSETQIEYDQLRKGLAPFKITGFKSYTSAFYNIVIENLNRQNITPKDWERTISISTAGIGPRVKKISSATKEVLIDSGRKGAEGFLKR